MATKFTMLVEGSDELAVFIRLFKHYDVPDKLIDIKPKEGIENLLRTLPTEIKGSNIEAVGVVVDADLDLPKRWTELCARLKPFGYSLPTQPVATGTILEAEDQPKVGIWVMPENTLPGMLEDFIGYLVPEGDRLWPIANESIERLPADCRKFSSLHVMKAQIHTWLAWQEQPGTPMGMAIAKRYLNADSQHARNLAMWLDELYSLDLPAFNAPAVIGNEAQA